MGAEDNWHFIGAAQHFTVSIHKCLMGQIQSLLKSMEKSLIDSSRLWIKSYLFICPSVLTFYVSHLSLSIPLAGGNLGRTKNMVKINKVTTLFNTSKKKKKRKSFLEFTSNEQKFQSRAAFRLLDLVHWIFCFFGLLLRN